jgi:outer membrane usher protein
MVRIKMPLNKTRSSSIDCRTLTAPRKRIVGLIVMALGQFPLHASAVPESAAKAALPNPAHDPDFVDFNTSFGGLDNGKVDISRFARSSNPVLPGTYRVDLYVNEMRVSREDIVFRDVPSRHSAMPCFPRPLLEKMGVAVDKLDPKVLGAGDTCFDLPGAVPGTQTSFDPGSLRLDVSIPQVSLDHRARGYVSPELWEQGETAATIGYSVSAYQSDSSYGGTNRSAFLGLNAGLNIAGWRLHNQASAFWASNGGSKWQNIGAYAQHDVTRLRSQLTLGDSFTTGELFQSTGFRGANLASDDRMLPDSMSGYAPVVRGIAETRARVEIRQNDYLIYETTVAPGAFEINDLYATGYGGDLQVSVIEADGRIRTFSVPYAAVPRLLRPGISRYSATVGQVRNTVLSGRLPLFVEATYQRGLNNWLTGYAGVQLADGDFYRSGLFGAAVNTGIGAFSVDITGSQATSRNQTHTWSGYSVRATYSKSIPSIYTDFALAAYRYSSSEYLDLADAVSLNSGQADTPASGAIPASFRARDRFQLTLNQRLGESAGSLYASASYYSYWNGVSNNTTYQIGYNNRFRNLNYSVTASQSRDGVGRNDTQVFMSVSIPLEVAGSARPPTFSATASGGGRQGSSLRAGLNGVAGEQGQFNYNVYATRNSSGSSGIDADANWQTPDAVLGGTYAWSNTGRQASVSASGGVVMHPHGITLAPRMSETIGIVEAKGASGALLSNGSQARVDSHGYAVVTDLMPYRMNDVSLDPKGTSMDVELESTRVQIAPRAGAVVPLKFDTVTGRAVLIKGRKGNGEVLPFGAQVLDAQGREVGVVGQDGSVFARGGEQGGQLTVRWGTMRASNAESTITCSPDPAVTTQADLLKCRGSANDTQRTQPPNDRIHDGGNHVQKLSNRCGQEPRRYLPELRKAFRIRQKAVPVLAAVPWRSDGHGTADGGPCQLCVL